LVLRSRVDSTLSLCVSLRDLVTLAIDLHLVDDWVGAKREIRLGALEGLLWIQHVVIVARLLVAELGAYVGDNTRE